MKPEIIHRCADCTKSLTKNATWTWYGKEYCNRCFYAAKKRGPTWEPPELKMAPSRRCEICSRTIPPEEESTITITGDVCMDCRPSQLAIKHDAHKPRYDLIPPEALDAFVQVLTYGAEKYEDRNWEKGMPWGRFFAACMRHLWAWWRGETNDPETGLPHLAHACCCIMFLLTYECRGVGEDDRTGGE